MYLRLADLTVLLHFLFVLFVILGGIAALRWRWLVWLHLPAVAWGVAIELIAWICPLTYLENYFRRRGGEAGYEGGFIARYIEPVLYPVGLTPGLRIILALGIIVLNILIYRHLWRTRPDTRS